MSTRRQFLAFATGWGGALCCGATAWLVQQPQHSARGKSSSALIPGPDPLVASSRKGWALGSEVSITALHHDSRVAVDGIDAAFAELELVEEVMSIYRPQSQLSRLNREGVLENPHPYLCEVLTAATEMSRRSDGAFDVTVQPLWNLFSEHLKRGTEPSTASIEQAKESVGWQRVHNSNGQIRLSGQGTAITLNGIAQGFATDKAIAALQSRGICHALINAGEIGSLGQKGPGEEWTVGIQHPRRADAYISLAKLAGRCLATSGDYATKFRDDFRSHHIFDPRTGTAPTELASVSIAAPTAMQADALSTGVFVLGPERGADLVRATAGADALFVLKNGRTLVTDGFVS